MPRTRRSKRKSKNKSKSKSQSSKPNATEAKSSEANASLQNQTVNLHSTYIGFKNQQDWQQCLDLHLTLLQCSLINNLETNIDQNILKEISTYATGSCMNCITCNNECLVLYGTTTDDDGIWNSCRENEYYQWDDMDLAKIFGNNGYFGYSTKSLKGDGAFYVCSDCCPALKRCHFRSRRLCSYCSYPVIEEILCKPHFNKKCKIHNDNAVEYCDVMDRSVFVDYNDRKTWKIFHKLCYNEFVHQQQVYDEDADQWEVMNALTWQDNFMESGVPEDDAILV